MSIQIFCPILIKLFVLLLTCKSSFYILYASPLSDIFFANIFFWPVAYLFIFKTMSFEAHKSLIFIKFDLPISFVGHAFDVIYK